MRDTMIVGTTMTDDEVSNLYKEYPGYWFLMEVLKSNAEGKAVLMKVTRYDMSKEVLRDHLLDNTESTQNRFIFVYASPDGRCEINLTIDNRQ